MIGVAVQEVTPELAKQFDLPNSQGALVSQVNRDSPAARAGIQRGDDIVRYGGHDITDTSELRNLVAATAPGTQVPVVVIRNGKHETVNVTVGNLAAEAAAQPAHTGASELVKLGLRVQALTPELAGRYGLQADHGVVITDVQEGSAASFAGLQTGDLIVEADRKPVNDVSDLTNALANAKNQILLLISRKGTETYVVFALQ
jgi:serine protease Do